MPTITQRIGLDLHIIDATVEDEALWLRALIWPEHRERRELLQGALAVRRRELLDLRAGDGVARLGSVLEEIPAESVPCVYHTHVANQFPPETTALLLRTLESAGRASDLFHLCNNIRPGLHLTAFLGGRILEQPLAHTDGHARWIEWIAD